MSAAHDDVNKDYAAIQLEVVDAVVKNGGKDSTEVHFDQKSERKAVLKLDLLLVSLMCSFYLLAFLDREHWQRPYCWTADGPGYLGSSVSDWYILTFSCPEDKS
jgi:hypothetical protein